MTATLALERRFPALAGRLPRCSFTDLPTPVHALERLGRARDLAGLWVKRDDLSGALYGGNKPRKLELVLGDVRARGRRSVLTFGGIGTHHGLATALCARAVGMRTILVLVPQPVTAHVRHCLLLDHAVGAELHVRRTVGGVALAAARLVLRGVLRGDPPALIPPGGSSTLGTIGYVSAGLELAEQVAAGALPEPAAVFVPLGSGGTFAGITLGLRLAGIHSRVVGVLVTDILPPSSRRLAGLARAALRRLRALDPTVPALAIEPADLTVVDGFLGAGYGAPTPAGEEAVRLLAEHEGLGLESTYSAKCLAALLDAAGGAPYRGRNLLFWHTFSAVDPGSTLALPRWQELPPAFHRFFAPG